MLSQKLEKLLVEQISKEFYSSNLYLSMASWAEISGYPGVSRWMHAQAVEERVHLLKFISFVNSRGGKTIIPAVEQPPVEFESVLDIFEKTYIHEQEISQSINNIMAVTMADADFMTASWMQWFVTEQIEEEKSVCEILDRLRLVGDGQLYMFDADVESMRNNKPVIQ